MDVGNNKVLKLNNAKGNITWKSSNTKIVSIKKKSSNSVTLSAKKKGNATITATYKGKKYTCKVNITKPKMKYDTWEEETVMLGHINTVEFEKSDLVDFNATLKWSIDDPTIAKLTVDSKNSHIIKLESLTHGETYVRAIEPGVTHIMKVIVPEVKLDVAKILMDSSKLYTFFNGVTEQLRPIYVDTYYDENGNDITDLFVDTGLVITYDDKYDKTLMTSRGRNFKSANSWLGVKFIGTDISASDVQWESSNKDSLIYIDSDANSKSGRDYCYWRTLEGNKGGKGSTVFSTKLGNESFSFILEYDLCALPE